MAIKDTEYISKNEALDSYPRVFKFRGRKFIFSQKAMLFLQKLINNRFATEGEIARCSGLSLLQIRNTYITFVNAGFNIRRKELRALKSKKGRRGYTGVPPIVVIYYIK